MSEFKVGSRVVFKTYCSSKCSVGKVGVISAVEGDTVKVRLDCGYLSSDLSATRYLSLHTAYPNPPHKHAELIKAWADGAEIENENSKGEWVPALTPTWNLSWTYRIKPQKSTKDIKLEELEAKALELAKEIKELRNASN